MTRPNSDDLAIIRQAAIFGSLGQETLDSLLTEATVSTYNRGEMIFMQGDSVRAFYVVLDGWIKVYRTTPSGDEAIVGIFHRAQSFAEAAAFTGGVYPASGETVSAVRLLRISARHLVDRVMESPEIGLAMLASTSHHLHLLIGQIEQLKAHTGAQRVAQFLASLAPIDTGPCTISIPYDKALLAGKLGMKPESLSRAFQRLKACGVSIRRDMAIVNDVEFLREFVDRDRSETLRSRA